MVSKNDIGPATIVEQGIYPVPDIPLKDLLDAIPAHCYWRSALRSSVYVFWDNFVIVYLFKAASYLDTLINPATLALPHPHLYLAARISLWALQGLLAGLFATSFAVMGHECGHQAFSDSKVTNNAVGWLIHSACGVPYHSWRVTHAKHHALTAHMMQDQVFVPSTRSYFGLPPLDSTKECRLGSRVREAVRKELWDALGDSPIGAVLGLSSHLMPWWVARIHYREYLWSKRYPKGTSHFNPKSPMFAPHHYGQVVVSIVGILLSLGALGASMYQFGFLQVFLAYLVPYLCNDPANHWLVLVTFLQHTDPLLPHYRAPEFNFTRGALSTLDRHLLGDIGPIMGWLGAHATHGISETHVHHVSSKIPHYNAWEASATLKKRLANCGIPTKGAPAGWAELYRVFKECKFIEDKGDVMFYKNAYGMAKMNPSSPMLQQAILVSRLTSNLSLVEEGLLRACCD